MNTLPQFHAFLDELQHLINKHRGDDPKLLTKDQRIAFAARQTLPLYRKQFAFIVEYVANVLELDAGLIDQSRARCRFARVAWARHLCMMYCAEFSDAPQAAIAAYFGCPSHGGVGYARRNVAAACEVNKTEAAFVDRLRIDLKECLTTAAAMLKAKERIPLIEAANVGPNYHERSRKDRKES